MRRAPPTPTLPPPPPRPHLPDPDRPALAALVIVEGPADAAAVRAAVRAPIHSLRGATRTRNREGLAALRAAVGGAAAAVVLTDPDAAGRTARGDIGRALAASSPALPVYHAFISVPDATAGGAVRAKAAGDVGVEHASPAVVAAALAAARRGRPQAAAPCAAGSGDAAAAAAPPPPTSSGPFTAEYLVDRGLAAPFNARQPGGGGGGQGVERPPPPTTTAARRAAVCAALGLGPCTGGQLLTALNAWGFVVADLDAVLAVVDGGGEVGGGGEGGV